MRDCFSFGSFHLRAIDEGPLEGARLFRSASLVQISQAEAAFLANDLKLRSIYDLRNRKEIASNPEPRIVGIKTMSFEPAVDRGRSNAAQRLIAGVIGEYGNPEKRMVENYRRYADEFSLMGTVLRTIAAEQLPALVHCEHGKDRTGVLCAVLLRVAGFSEDEVMAAYLKTNTTNAETTACEIATLGQGMSDEEYAILLSFLEARPAYLHAFFHEIDQQAGSFDAYVRDALRLKKIHVANLCALLSR